MSKVRICAISDMHGILPENIEPCDILFIGGDISPFDIQLNMLAMREWITTTFAYWINSLPVDKVYLVPGNHDFYFQGLARYKLLEFLQSTHFKVCVLENESALYRCEDGSRISIFGTPYCHIFGRWAYMRAPDYLKEAFSEIPEEVDIILAHDAPFNVGGQDVMTELPRHREQPGHIGNPELAERLGQIKYKWLIHGHIHSSEHIPEEFNGGLVVNVSLMNEECSDLIYEPFYFEFET